MNRHILLLFLLVIVCFVLISVRFNELQLYD